MAVPERVLNKMDGIGDGSLASDRPQRGRYQTAIKSGATMRTSLMQQAWKREGIDASDPPALTQVYLPEEGLLIIDLNSGGDCHE